MKRNLALGAVDRSSVDDDQNPMNDRFIIDDIDKPSQLKMNADCSKFQAEQANDLLLSGIDDEKAGRCFWLNRNGHGSGFWDEYSQTTCDQYEVEQAKAIISRDFSARDALNKTCDCPYHACQRLSQAAKAFGQCDLIESSEGVLTL